MFKPNSALRGETKQHLFRHWKFFLTFVLPIGPGGIVGAVTFGLSLGSFENRLWAGLLLLVDLIILGHLRVGNIAIGAVGGPAAPSL